MSQVLDREIYQHQKKIDFKKSPSLESQIASISDDIAYNNHDVEDALRADVLSENKKIKNSISNKNSDLLFFEYKKTIYLNRIHHQ